MPNKTQNIVFRENVITKSIDVVSKFYNIGRQDSEKGYYYKPHIHEEFEFVYVIEGSIKTRIDGEEFTVEKGGFYFVQPSQQHEEFSDSEFVSFYYIKGSFYRNDGKTAYITQNKSQQVIQDCPQELKKTITRMFSEMDAKRLGYWQMMEALITELLCHVIRTCYDDTPEFSFGRAATKPSYGNHIVNRVAEIMKANEKRILSVAEMSSAVCVSESYLYSVFKKHLNTSPKKFQMMLKIDQAKLMLLRTDLTVKTIAMYYGFEDVASFNKAFKRLCGVSPREYRLQCKKEFVR